MPSIVLATLNARYAHASLGLRCLRANMGDLRDDTVIREFVIRTPPEQIVADLLALQPTIVGLGVYIWNVRQTTRVVELLKAAAPRIVVVLGGPEVSHEIDAQPICRRADHIVTGWGDTTFPRLARQLLAGPRPLAKVHAGEQAPLADLALPYAEYSSEDLRHRHVYVEASRGCPFKCEFCLSALDRTAWPFPRERFLQELDSLWQRGARRFKFVDRTFNLRTETSVAILDFFLQRLAARAGRSAVPALRADPGSPAGGAARTAGAVPARVTAARDRHPDLQCRGAGADFATAGQRCGAANLRWLREHTAAHLHVDLIAGLPDEDLDSLAAGFDRLVGLGPHEIQLGILKRLRGTPIVRHSERCAMRYSDEAPYEVLSTGRIDAATMQRIKRFARYWDLVANSGRFPRTLPRLLGDAPFARFMAFADALFASTRRTHGFAVEELYGAGACGTDAKRNHPRPMHRCCWRWTTATAGRAADCRSRHRGWIVSVSLRRPSVTLERQRRHLRD